MREKRLGRYEIEDEVGRGGMSVVYRAIDPALERPVALKVLHPHLADRADSRARFSREARAVARFQHPHIVEVFDFAPPESERAYIVTEFIDGPTLREFVDQHAIRHPEVAALIMVPVLEALEHAHAGGIVHRDVKPENIMIRPDGTPVLMDFGIAQMVDMQTLTATGTMLGSPAHMAPEVIDGEEVRPAADVFSAGTVLYWLVCGALPFTGPNPAALFRKVLECRFDPVLQRRPHAGRPLARLIERCLRRDPEERPASAAKAAEKLRDILANAGLRDVDAELTAFFADPDVYQDDLGRRLVPAYIASARRAHSVGATARALDFLDRALGIDEAHPEALSLLHKIERGQRWGRVVRAAGLLLLLGGGGALAWWLWPEAPPEPDPPRAVLARDAALTAVVPDSAATRPPPVDAGPAMPPDAAPDAAPDATPDTGRRVIDRRRRRRRRPVAVVTRKDAGPARVDQGVTVMASRTPLRIAGGAYKRAMVWIGGNKYGPVFQIEARQRQDRGIKLPPGTHTVKIVNPGCRTFYKTIRIEPGQEKAEDVKFDCVLKPALLRIESNQVADIRNEKGDVLGQTNRDIEIAMKNQERRLRVIIGDPTGRHTSRQVTLQAGRRSSERVDL